MPTINGSPIGPDGLGGAFRTTDSDDRAALWSASGRKQRLVSGGTIAGRAGEMALDVAALNGFVAERDASGNLLDRGYHAWSDVTTTLVFDPASVSTRNDAVVLAVADTSAGSGAFGTGVTEAGAQLLVVPGVSGTATPVTDNDIQAFVGGGGWLRLADVPIAPTDTEINTATMTLGAQSGWLSFNSFQNGHVNASARGRLVAGVLAVLDGAIDVSASTRTGGQVACILPQILWPAEQIAGTLCYLGNSAAVTVDIRSNGEVFVYYPSKVGAGAGANFLYLSSVRYYVA